jgi:hypothetical protein
MQSDLVQDCGFQMENYDLQAQDPASEMLGLMVGASEQAALTNEGAMSAGPGCAG